MPIYLDDEWHAFLSDETRVKRVYRDEVLIGRVRRWQVSEPGELTREWYTAERCEGSLFVQIEGKQPDFEEALQRVVFYGVAH
ncbi:hypothetical protein [Methylobacterium nodulans]|uniref:Uncharacterized protein n=1 Tax=Methylobacterium nodulans (strain LMG 21967 / CNCM I-2342 / ORS 2060) TaxID=460265 RepID=B8IDL6_METNO|nr:hypothetical protein [Methylobacterium nodulans]ACL55588.1 conserved hypothetical protein [Methylobacterium nodulans ORS 2060]